MVHALAPLCASSMRLGAAGLARGMFSCKRVSNKVYTETHSPTVNYLLCLTSLIMSSVSNLNLS
jgi:hypothetical protein